MKQAIDLDGIKKDVPLTTPTRNVGGVEHVMNEEQKADIARMQNKANRRMLKSYPFIIKNKAQRSIVNIDGIELRTNRGTKDTVNELIELASEPDASPTATFKLETLNGIVDVNLIELKNIRKMLNLRKQKTLQIAEELQKKVVNGELTSARQIKREFNRLIQG